MIEKKDNLILEDSESEFIYKKNASNLNIHFNRIAFIFFVFLIIAIIFSSKVIYLGSLHKELRIKTKTKSDFRSTILDRKGNIIAKSVITTNIGINPNLVIDKKRLLLNLKLIFPNKNYHNIKIL